ncbi:MAG: type II secretion system F family protein [Candidatus Bilamarchaeaceae archaeon]
MAEKTTERGIFYQPAEMLARRFVDLKTKLRLAGINKTPVEFMEGVILNTVIASVLLTFLSGILMYYLIKVDLIFLFPLFLVYVLVTFNYSMLYPEAAIMRRKRELDYEIVFAGRHILIALKSGMPLFDTFVGASSGYGEVSKEIKLIVDKMMGGVPATQAIREVVQQTPSKYFARVMMQISNSLASGADVGDSLEAVLDQISKEQMILLKEYSQKLTPIVMFYMLFGIVVPTIGVVLAAAFVAILAGGKSIIDSSALIPIMIVIALIQFLFLGVMESSRPKYLI